MPLPFSNIPPILNAVLASIGEPDLIEKLKNFNHPYMKDGCFVFFRVNFKPTSALLFFQ